MRIISRQVLTQKPQLDTLTTGEVQQLDKVLRKLFSASEVNYVLNPSAYIYAWVTTASVVELHCMMVNTTGANQRDPAIGKMRADVGIKY